MESLNEIKKEREHVPDFMYIQSLENYCEQLETLISAIANIDGAFITGEGDCNYTDEQALDKIMELVTPLWVGIATSRQPKPLDKCQECGNDYCTCWL